MNRGFARIDATVIQRPLRVRHKKGSRVVIPKLPALHVGVCQMAEAFDGRSDVEITEEMIRSGAVSRHAVETIFSNLYPVAGAENLRTDRLTVTAAMRELHRRPFPNPGVETNISFMEGDYAAFHEGWLTSCGGGHKWWDVSPQRVVHEALKTAFPGRHVKWNLNMDYIVEGVGGCQVGAGYWPTQEVMDASLGQGVLRMVKEMAKPWSNCREEDRQRCATPEGRAAYAEELFRHHYRSRFHPGSWRGGAYNIIGYDRPVAWEYHGRQYDPSEAWEDREDLILQLNWFSREGLQFIVATAHCQGGWGED